MIFSIQYEVPDNDRHSPRCYIGSLGRMSFSLVIRVKLRKLEQMIGSTDGDPDGPRILRSANQGTLRCRWRVDKTATRDADNLRYCNIPYDRCQTWVYIHLVPSYPNLAAELGNRLAEYHCPHRLDLATQSYFARSFANIAIMLVALKALSLLCMSGLAIADFPADPIAPASSNSTDDPTPTMAAGNTTIETCQAVLISPTAGIDCAAAGTITQNGIYPINMWYVIPIMILPPKLRPAC